MLNAARKHAEGVTSKKPSSLRKAKVRTTYLHCKALFKKKEGKSIDENALKGRREILELESEDTSRHEAEEKHHDVLSKWEEFKKHRERT